MNPIMHSKCFTFVLLLLISFNSITWCFPDQENSPIVSFQIVNPLNSSEYFKEVKKDQFHITKTSNIVVECLSTCPMKIIFSGIMPNKIEFTHMDWDQTTKLYRVSIGFKNIPQATGSYSCVNTDKMAKNGTFKSTIYIFADDDEKQKLFLLHWAMSEREAAEATSISPRSRVMILMPCITFRPDFVPSLYYYKRNFVGDATQINQTMYDYDNSQGFHMNITKTNYSWFLCALNYESISKGLKFRIREKYSKVLPASAAKDNRVIYWSGNPISVECVGIHPMEIIGFRKNESKEAFKMSSITRDNFYFKYLATFEILNRTDADRIVCKKTDEHKIYREWYIVFGEPTDHRSLKTLPVASIHFNSEKKLFYCNDSSDENATTTMAMINCHNVANCESARRFNPWTREFNQFQKSKLTLLYQYPYDYYYGISLAHMNLNKELQIEKCPKCAILQQEQAVKLGIAYCSLDKDYTSIQSLQYFVDLNGQIAEEMNYKELADVLRIRMSKYNKNETSLMESIEFICEASIFIFAEGLEFNITFEFENDSTIKYPYKSKPAKGNDTSKITLHETISIWSENITEFYVECHALKWDNQEQEWEKVSTAINVKEIQEPTIINDKDHNNSNSTVKIIMFRHTDLHKNISCTIEGFPLPTIRWVKQDNVTNSIVETNKTTKFVTSTVLFTDVLTLRDANCTYVCIAENAAGETNMTFSITFTTNITSVLLKDTNWHGQWIYYAIGATCLVVLMLLVAVCLLCRTLKSRQDQIEKLSELEIHQFMNGDEDLVHRFQELHEAAQYLPYKQQFEIHPSKIEIKNDVLGTGNYGMVLKGILQKSGKKFPVAVKTVKSGTDIRHLRSLLSELKIMMYIGSHPYIVKMMGAITKNIRDGKLYVAVEFCANGNLQNYLRLCRPIFHNQIVDDNIKTQELIKIPKKARRLLNIDHDHAITSAIEKRRSGQRYSYLPEQPELALIKTTTLVNWCYQIASGMEYLALKKVIHGDLASRNVLITDDLSIKITDFGLSGYLYDYSNYVTKEKGEAVPWRWLSIEAIQDSKFSTQSDVWAYGITLWEIFSLGETPYQGFCWGEEFVQDLCLGYRLGKPQYATNDIHNTMLKCWNKAANDRPSFQDISKYFEELMERVGTRLDDITSVKDERVSPAHPIPEIFICEGQ